MKDDEIKKKILLIAKDEFMNKGFMDASMRIISSKANLTTGSLYNRFKDKEALFSAIVKENADQLLFLFQTSQNDFAVYQAREQLEKLKDYVDGKLILMLDYIYDHFDNFKLLICKAKGSQFENYVESFIQIEQANTTRYIDTLSGDGISIKLVSEDINHMLASSLFNGFFQIVEHDYSKEEAIEYVQTLYQFFRAGWNKLLGINKEQ